jgi:histone demethylase
MSTSQRDLPQLTFSDQESAYLNKLDSLDFGFMSTDTMFDSSQTNKHVVEKGIKFYQLLVANSVTEENSITHLCKLGHLHLLLGEFSKALSAYQKCLQLQKDLSKNAVLLYGLGMVYFHYNAFDWAIKAFEQLLVVKRDFSHSTEVHLRLAVMFKVTKDFGASLKHFKEALSNWNQCSLMPIEGL